MTPTTTNTKNILRYDKRVQYLRKLAELTGTRKLYKNFSRYTLELMVEAYEEEPWYFMDINKAQLLSTTYTPHRMKYAGIYVQTTSNIEYTYIYPLALDEYNKNKDKILSGIKNIVDTKKEKTELSLKYCKDKLLTLSKQYEKDISKKYKPTKAIIKTCMDFKNIGIRNFSKCKLERIKELLSKNPDNELSTDEEIIKCYKEYIEAEYNGQKEYYEHEFEESQNILEAINKY